MCDFYFALNYKYNFLDAGKLKNVKEKKLLEVKSPKFKKRKCIEWSRVYISIRSLPAVNVASASRPSP